MMTRQPLGVRFPPCGIFLIESHHADDFRMDWTTHAFLKFLYVIRGRGRLLTADGGFSLEPGRVAVIPPGKRHRIVDGEPLSLYALCLQLAVVPVADAAIAGCRSAAHPALRDMAEQLLKEMLYEQTVRHPGWESMLVGQALILWSGWVRWQAGRPPKPRGFDSRVSHHRVEIYLEELRQGFYRRENLETVAARCDLGARRFSQIFRELTGTSWLAFIRARRISHARRLLLETSRSVTSVCFECGFEDLSNFYRAFHQSNGSSPQLWREQNQRKTNPAGSRK